MESDRFDTLTAPLASPLSRRTSVGLLSTLGIGRLAVADQADAKKKKKTTLCLNSQTITIASKKKRKTLLKLGATTGACPTCAPQCQGQACGADGCGGSCGTCGAVPCTNGLCSCTGQTDTTDCGSGRQCSGEICATPPTCSAAGAGCAAHAECCSDLCLSSGSYCYGLGDIGSPCVTVGDCILGARCVGFVCQA